MSPMILRVPNNTGASGVPGVLHVYNYCIFGPIGWTIVQMISHYPRAHELYITSGTDGDHGNRSYHYEGMPNGYPGYAAVDIGAFDGITGNFSHYDEGARRMRDYAAYAENTIPGYRWITELIHTTPFVSDNGYYVKNGVQIASYGPATDEAHKNHIHEALSLQQANSGLYRAQQSYPRLPQPQLVTGQWIG